MRAGQQLNKPKIICRAPLKVSRRLLTGRASFRQRLVAGVVFLLLAAFFGVLALAGHYKIGLWPFPCGFKQRYNLPCPGCGITTSVVAFAQGKIFEAFYIQPAAALLCCILVVAAFLAFLMAVFGVYFSFINRFFAEVKVRYIVLALIVIIAAGWAVTLARAIAANSQG
jgi:hypothetical protein